MLATSDSDALKLRHTRVPAKLAQNARVQADVQQYRSTRTMSARFAAER